MWHQPNLMHSYDRLADPSRPPSSLCLIRKLAPEVWTGLTMAECGWAQTLKLGCNRMSNNPWERGRGGEAGRGRERESHGQYKLAFSAMQRPKSPMQTTIKTISLQNVAASASWHLLLPFYFIFILALCHPETKLTLSENWRELSLVDSLPSVFLPRTVARLNWSDFRARPFILVSHIWSAAVKWRRSSPRNKLLREVAVLLLLHRHCCNAIGYSMQWVCFCCFFAPLTKNKITLNVQESEMWMQCNQQIVKLLKYIINNFALLN